MSNKPIYNALAAILYIVLIVLAINGISRLGTGSNEIVVPIIMLSLFTLSAAVMGYLFCYQPLRLYLDGKKEEAVKLFIRTVGIFGGITIVITVVYFIITNIL